MKKADALALFDNKPSKLAAACGLSRAAVTKWPDELSDSQRDRVLAALWRRHAMPLADAASANDVPGFMLAVGELARIARATIETAEEVAA